jgi:hypothetical protein
MKHMRFDVWEGERDVNPKILVQNRHPGHPPRYFDLRLTGKLAYSIDRERFGRSGFLPGPPASHAPFVEGNCHRNLVDETGIEPATSSLRTMRSPS